MPAKTPSEPTAQKVASDQEFRAALNNAVSTAIRWKRVASAKESRINKLKEFSAYFAQALKEDMVDDEGTPLWTDAEMVLALIGSVAIVAYGSIFPEKQKSILMKLSRDQNKENE